MPLLLSSAPSPAARRRATWSRAGLVALAAAAALPASASADWSLSIEDNVNPRPGSTLPDRVSAYEYAYSESGPPQFEPSALEVVRGGTVAASKDLANSTFFRGIELEVGALQVGDVVRVSARSGAVLTSTTYDGKPALDQPVCVGATSFSGTRQSGTRTYLYVIHPGGLGSDYVPGPTGDHSGKFTVGGREEQPGETFVGTLRFPLITGQSVFTGTYLESRNPAVPSVSTTIETIVAASCVLPAKPGPVAGPPAAQPPVVDKGAPQATGTVLPTIGKKTKLDDLIKKGLLVGLTPSEDARVVATMSLQTPAPKGKGASAKPKKGKKGQPKVVVLGTAAADALAGKPVTVTVKAAKGSKKKLSAAAKNPKSRLLVQVKLTDKAGNTTTLPATALKLPKK